MTWASYRKTQTQEMRPHIPGEDMTGISVSEPDQDKLDKPGGMVARNSSNHDDQWYIAADFFNTNYEKV